MHWGEHTHFTVRPYATAKDVQSGLSKGPPRREKNHPGRPFAFGLNGYSGDLNPMRKAGSAMKLMFKKIVLGLYGLLLVVSGLWLDYYLPEKTIATITGVEVKRVDKDGPIGRDNPADGPTTDVYYIYTERAGEIV